MVRTAAALSMLLPLGAIAQTDRLSQFLMHNAWCSFSYNKNTGTSRQERVVFQSVPGTDFPYQGLGSSDPGR